MLRQRNRPQWSDDDRAGIYAGRHDHRVLSPGHDLRMERLAALCAYVHPNPFSAADLSCGYSTLARDSGAVELHLGDLAPGLPIVGPIEETIDLIPHVDLFVCTETLEHLWDPDDVLRRIRPKAATLVCSVPISEVPEDDGNGEHYWVFDREGAEAMLSEAGWKVIAYEQVEAGPGSVTPTYQCGLFACR